MVHNVSVRRRLRELDRIPGAWQWLTQGVDRGTSCSTTIRATFTTGLGYGTRRTELPGPRPCWGATAYPRNLDGAEITRVYGCEIPGANV